MEFVISQFEGSSGNFLGRLLSGYNLSETNTFRVDGPLKDSVVLSANGVEDWYQLVERTSGYKVLVCHQFDQELIKTTFPSAKSIPIWPYTRQMAVVWNICFKKVYVKPHMHIIDNFYIDIKFWHEKLLKTYPNYNCYDFGKLNDIEYVESITGEKLSDAQQNFFAQYWSEQNPLDLTWPDNKLDIPEIISWYKLTEEHFSPWYIALVIYTFEMLHGDIEHRREWSIDDVNLSNWRDVASLETRYSIP